MSSPFADQFSGGIDWSIMIHAANQQIEAYCVSEKRPFKSIGDNGNFDIYVKEMHVPHVPMWVYVGCMTVLPVLWTAKIDMTVHHEEKLVRRELFALLANDWEDGKYPQITAFPMCLLITHLPADFKVLHVSPNESKELPSMRYMTGGAIPEENENL